MPECIKILNFYEATTDVFKSAQKYKYILNPKNGLVLKHILKIALPLIPFPHSSSASIYNVVPPSERF